MVYCWQFILMGSTMREGSGCGLHSREHLELDEEGEHSFDFCALVQGETGMCWHQLAAKYFTSLSAKGTSTPQLGWICVGKTADGSGFKSLSPAGNVIAQAVTDLCIVKTGANSYEDPHPIHLGML